MTQTEIKIAQILKPVLILLKINLWNMMLNMKKRDIITKNSTKALV